MTYKHLFFSLLLFGLAGPRATAAQPAPEAYQVHLRYQIAAFGNDRIVQYAEMMNKLKALGFQADPRPESDAVDPTANRLTGTIAAKDARKLFQERHVRSVLLIPQGARALDKPDALVRVQLELATGLAIDRQRVLAEQTRAVLGTLGFHEGVAYDERGFTRLVGAFPEGKLELLLGDLRRAPAGEKLPAPFQVVSPVLVTEVMPDVPLPKERPKMPEPPAEQEKLSPDLRSLLGNEAEAAKPRRLEVILSSNPGPTDRRWEADLYRMALGLVIEGRVGSLVTVVARPDHATLLARLPSVSVVRLPQLAQGAIQSGGALGDNQAALRASSLDRLHALGHRGRGIRVAVVDGDFRGWSTAQAAKQLPASTRYVDLTSERNQNLEPDPFPGDPKTLGRGTRCALAVALAAPEAELTLVRIDPAAPYQLLDVARYINGEPVQSYPLAQRVAEIETAKEVLDARRQQLLEERRLVLEDFGDETANARREAYLKNQAAFDRDERAHVDLVRRYLAIRTGYAELRKVRLVASSLVWNEGHPVDGGSGLSRYFDDQPFRSTVWLQAAGDTRGQTWTGLFRDADGNGVMEFAAIDPARPSTWWQREVNFLGWKPADGAETLDLPAGAEVRITIQWREPRDPAFLHEGEDLYLKPLVNPRLLLLHQLDPTGTQRPKDDTEVAAFSVGPALRLQNDARSSTYEQTVAFTVPAAGRYALRVEGMLPGTIRPAGVPSLPAQQKSWEMRPRLFIHTKAGPGRAVFHDYATDAGSLGVPGDAHDVLTIGAADQANQREPYSAGGPPLGMELLHKPDMLAYDRWMLGGMEMAEGTDLAASHAAGLAACLLSAGMPPQRFVETVRSQAGGVLRVPDYLTVQGRR
jgi:hypothetical protein